jgi:hypothetical protein
MRDLPIRIAIMAAALLVAAVGVAVAVVFLCLALYSTFLTLLSAPLAALASALLVFVLSLLVILLGRLFANLLRGRRPRTAAGRAHAIGIELGRLLDEDAQAFIAKKPILALVLALVGGFVVGVNPKLRAFLQAIIKN